MPIGTCSIIIKKTLKNDSYFASRDDTPSLSSLLSLSSQLPHSQQAFALPPLHETSTQRARKYYPRENRYVPKITLEQAPPKRDYDGQRALWGINSLSFILPWFRTPAKPCDIPYTILPGACSQFSPVKPKVQTQRYFLLVYPVKHVPLLRQG